MNLRSIHSRLILWYSGLVILVSLIFGAYLYDSLQSRLYAQMEFFLLHRADNVNKVFTGDPSTAANRITYVYSPEENDRFIRISKDDGSIFYASGQPRSKSFDITKISSPPKLAGIKRVEHLAEDTDMMIVTILTTYKNENYFIEVGGLTKEANAALSNLVSTLLYGLPVVIFIISAGGYMLVRRSLKPVEDIRVTAQEITFGNLQNRLPVANTGDELENLSTTLNQMLGRLEDAYQQTSRFSADASHELRTPLTIMRGELESLASEKLPKKLNERVHSVLEEVERLSHITESLFAISRLDAGEAKVANIKFDLAELVKTTTEQMQLMAVEKSISIKAATSNPVAIDGDPARLKQVVVNLLDNAIKYTQKKGSISIKVLIRNNKAILEISDSGIGIPAESLPHIFERFYRADKMRSREQGGAGLGLSIVRSICLAHGGNVEITSKEGKGTTCRVELPLA